MASFKVKSDNIQLDYNSHEQNVADLLNSKGRISSLLVDKIYPKHIKSFSDYKNILYLFYVLIGLLISILFFFLMKGGITHNIIQWLLNFDNMLKIGSVEFHTFFELLPTLINILIDLLNIILVLIQGAIFCVSVGLLYALPALLCVFGGIFAGLSFKNSNKGRRQLILFLNLVLIILCIFMAAFTYLTWFL